MGKVKDTAFQLMPIDSPKYDVALSFLTSDQATAAALYRQLSEGLSVFFYPRNQEELAGTDGLESMRTPFLSESRVMVVLYRERWSKTPWTRIEETAIKDACLAHGWRRLFFLVMDRSSALPVWLPETHVRFDYAEYGIEQAVGAIKARVQENGGKFEPLTAMKRAEMYKYDESYRNDKLTMNTSQGLQEIVGEVANLFEAIQARCVEISEEGHLQLKAGAEFRAGNARQECIVTDGIVSLAVIWQQHYSNILEGTSLIVREFNAALPMPAERFNRSFIIPPEKVRERKYLPDLSLARQYGWKEQGATEFLSSAELAERCVIGLLDLVDRRSSGKLAPPRM